MIEGGYEAGRKKVVSIPLKKCDDITTEILQSTSTVVSYTIANSLHEKCSLADHVRLLSPSISAHSFRNDTSYTEEIAAAGEGEKEVEGHRFEGSNFNVEHQAGSNVNLAPA